MSLPRLKINRFNTCTLICCKAGVAQTVTPFRPVQHGEELGPNADLLRLWAYFSLPHFFSYFILLFLLFPLWTPGDAWDSCGLVIVFHLIFFFLSTELSSSHGFTFLTRAPSLSPTPASPLPCCLSLLFPAFLPAGPASWWTEETVCFLLLVALGALF